MNYTLRLRPYKHKFSIETGRYCNIERSQRTCEHCTLNLLGDEYHLFFVCNNPEIVQLRYKFIPNYYRTKPSMYKFVKLLKSLDKLALGIRICKFLKYCKYV